MNIIMPIIFALTAAIGNAMFAFGQKKSLAIENKISFVLISVVFCILFTAIAVPFFGKYNYITTLKNNWTWTAISGLGLFLTYIGFNLLYTRYGASHYVLYAILSIFTTSIMVGVFIFKETLNTFQYVALALSLISIILFSI